MTETEYSDDQLSEDEKRALSALPTGKLPPAELEEKIVAQLKDKGLIESSTESRWTGTLRYVAVAAAAALIFALGVEVGSIRSSAPDGGTESSDTRQFMLLLFESPGRYQSVPEARITERVSEYGNWMRGVVESGVDISGEKLKDEGRALFAGSAGMQVNAIPPPSEGRLLAGYFAIEASSLDEALRIGSSCPHLKYGGEIEVREIDRITNTKTH